jgi:hypothetical protein
LFELGTYGGKMTDIANIILRVEPVRNEDGDDLIAATARLRGELLDLDVHSVDLVPDGDAPEGAKGLSALAGWLGVHLGKEALRTVLTAAANWASRNSRTVEVRSGRDLLKLGNATKEQQDKIIDAWLAAHAPNS